MAVSTWSRTLPLRGSSPGGSNPPVSTRVKDRSSHSTWPIILSRVVPGMSVTTASRRPTKPVEQGGLADVRPADDGYQWFSHLIDSKEREMCWAPG